jgi:hypothetical protein
MASPSGAYLLAAIFSERIYSPSELRKVFEEAVPLVLPVVGELVAAGMAQHVAVNEEGEPGSPVIRKRK